MAGSGWAHPVIMSMTLASWHVSILNYCYKYKISQQDVPLIQLNIWNSGCLPLEVLRSDFIHDALSYKIKHAGKRTFSKVLMLYLSRES